jgi:hypothetical protein
MKNRDDEFAWTRQRWLSLENELPLFFQGDEFARDDIEMLHG